MGADSASGTLTILVAVCPVCAHVIDQGDEYAQRACKGDTHNTPHEPQRYQPLTFVFQALPLSPVASHGPA